MADSNFLKYTEVWTKTLDQQAEQQATSGWMEGNASRVQYTGGKSFKVPTIKTTGLGDYKRGTGAGNRGSFPNGKVDLTYEDYSLTQDRGTTFAFDRMDVDETGLIIQAPTVMADFQKYNVIPELDAYRYSKIASTVLNSTDGRKYSETLTADNIIQRFTTEIREMQDKTGLDTGNLVAVMPYNIYAIFEQAAIAKSYLMPQSFQQGGINLEVKGINGIPLIPVVSNRMMTSYLFHDGTSDMGFEAATGAKQINWIITPRNLPIAISKLVTLNVFAPSSESTSDDWVITYRRYHDLWLMVNQINQIIVSVAE